MNNYAGLFTIFGKKEDVCIAICVRKNCAEIMDIPEKFSKKLADAGLTFCEVYALCQVLKNIFYAAVIFSFCRFSLCPASGRKSVRPCIAEVNTRFSGKNGAGQVFIKRIHDVGDVNGFVAGTALHEKTAGGR
jgi:hypothetical protein